MKSKTLSRSDTISVYLRLSRSLQYFQIFKINTSVPFLRGSVPFVPFIFSSCTTIAKPPVRPSKASIRSEQNVHPNGEEVIIRTELNFHLDGVELSSWCSKFFILMQQNFHQDVTALSSRRSGAFIKMKRHLHPNGASFCTVINFTVSRLIRIPGDDRSLFGRCLLEIFRVIFSHIGSTGR